MVERHFDDMAISCHLQGHFERPMEMLLALKNIVVGIICLFDQLGGLGLLCKSSSMIDYKAFMTYVVVGPRAYIY